MHIDHIPFLRHISLDDLGQLFSKLLLTLCHVVLIGDLNIDMMSTCVAIADTITTRICLVILI